MCLPQKFSPKHNSQMYFSCSFPLLLAFLIQSRAMANTKNTRLFVSFSEKRWMRQDGSEVVFFLNIVVSTHEILNNYLSYLVSSFFLTTRHSVVKFSHNIDFPLIIILAS